METIIDNDDLSITMKQGETDNVIFCFSGIGLNLGVIKVQKEEFYRISNYATTFFIIDKQRSWGNNIDFEELNLLLKPYIENKKLYSIGNSMGGFLAIAASKYFDFEVVISFVPQYSMSKTFIPGEKRFKHLVNNIKNWKIESLDGHFLDRTQYYIFMNNRHMDKIQLSYFPNQNNIHKIITDEDSWNHNNFSAKLKDFGILYKCISSCIEKKSVSHIQNIISNKVPNIKFI